MSALEDEWPDERRRNHGLERYLVRVMRPQRSPLTDCEIVALRLYSHGMNATMVAETGNYILDKPNH
jgi:hypothetical protein